MAAYVIGALTVHNPDWQQEYGSKMPALIQKHGGKLLARTPAALLEGEALLHGVTVMIEFPTTEQAQAWHADPDHQPLRKLRQSGSHMDMMLVDGL
ncbi:DUF1330 domain-containing protein [Rugamonas apoptosis]|uniref:DUF1330 domain-containing protein n=1 Tax=Rugamonas apoptosis TaxID=2758570 RepID=A0A7W2IL04_9BURK|nr:DUF1330 domain-containing protein [Rugamonas apoptosis]MBA5687931.1 DUF1330 domain-containing protein [Rugamonas apoptosis]